MSTSFVCQCAELVDACTAYLRSSMRTSSSTEWLWAVACLAYAFSYQALLSDAISNLAATDARDHTASTQLASAVRLLDVLSAADEGARATEQAALLRQGVAETCDCLRSAPEVLVVGTIMRMDQLAVGRPLVRDSGVYLDLNGREVHSNKRHCAAVCSSMGSTGSPAKGKSSSSRGGSSSSQEWPEVPDALILSLLSKISWANLEAPEIAALYNQTPAVEYLCSQLLKHSVDELMQPYRNTVASQAAGWVEWEKGYGGDVGALKTEDLKLRITADLSSAEVMATVLLDDEGKRLPYAEYTGSCKVELFASTTSAAPTKDGFR